MSQSNEWHSQDENGWWPARLPVPPETAVDVWARHYNNAKRCWEHHRFSGVRFGKWVSHSETECSVQMQMRGRDGTFDIPADWEATHWRLPPKPPREAA